MDLSCRAVLINHRAYISASLNFFSGENEVKRRHLEVEECRLSLDEKAQIVQMINVGIYSPRTARRKIEEIDQRVNPPVLEPVPDSPTLGRPPSGSSGQCQARHRSPSLGRHSAPWDSEDPDYDDEENSISC